MRNNSSTLTLCHRKPEKGLNPIQIFDRFGYVKASRRDATIMKKKLFCTITGKGYSNLGFILRPYQQSYIDLFHYNEFICRWNLTDAINKMNKLILVVAVADGKINTIGERFHYVSGYLYNDLRPMNDLVGEGKIVIDFCIDQQLDGIKGPHDRGPHIRIPRRQLESAYHQVKVIL